MRFLRVPRTRCSSCRGPSSRSSSWVLWRVLEVVVEGLPLVFDDLLDVSLLVVVDLYLLDAVVGAEVALEVVGEEIGEFLDLLPIAFEVAQNLGDEVVQLLLHLFAEFLASPLELLEPGVVGPVVFHIHLPLEYIVKNLFVEESDFVDEMLQFIRKSFIVVLVDSAELLVEVADIPGPDDEDKCFLELVEEGGKSSQPVESALLVVFVAVVLVALGFDVGNDFEDGVFLDSVELLLLVGLEVAVVGHVVFLVVELGVGVLLGAGHRSGHLAVEQSVEESVYLCVLLHFDGLHIAFELFG